jgi:mono/diheme cytochrome c family protein
MKRLRYLHAENANKLAKSGALVAAAAAGLLGLSGCGKTTPVEFQSSPEVAALSAPLQDRVRKLLDQHCGTHAAPRLLGSDAVDAKHLRHGRDVYTARCSQCHGDTGDGGGKAAEFLHPRPRDYRKGVFKFTSTPFGARPRRDDLLRTVRVGVPGTSMPSFSLLPETDLQAVVDYVLALTRRGELEVQLAGEAEAAEEITEEVVPELIAQVLERWKEAESQEVFVANAQPQFTAQHVLAGKQAFLTKGCSKCHGEDGRGQTPENLRGDLKDQWGFPTRAADLTSGMLHGGRASLDVYRRIYSGINGTPMPAFHAALANEPDTIWNLVAYVHYVADRRRLKTIPEALPPEAIRPPTADAIP